MPPSSNVVFVESPEVLDHRLKIKRLEIWDNTIQSGIRWVGLVLICFAMAFCVRVLAGKYTFAQIGVSFLGSFKVSEAVSYGVGVVGVGYGLRERRLRRKNIERMSGQIAKLEEEIHQRRSSSHLT